MASTLREHREELGKSLEAVADETGVNVGTLSRYERGDFVPKPETAQKLVPGYEIPAEVIRYLCLQARGRKRKGAEASAHSV